jgi:predicted glycoside hydrolase/deacetylase ChbG (UPF0249 family)
VLKVIINADDLGMSAEVNRAVISAFRQHLCSSTTLMANMPGFTEACELVRDHKLIARVGLHLNLGEGFPLIDGMKRSRRFSDAEGRLNLASTQLLLFLSCEDRRILAEEIRAQIRRCRGMGIPLTHLDSHRHIHTRWAILSVLLTVASEEHIPYVRIPRNCGSSIGPMKATYKRLIVKWITQANMRGTRYFGTVADYVSLRESGHHDGLMEIMVHPRYASSGLLCNYPHTTSLIEDMQRVESYQGAISFRDIKHPLRSGWAGQ